MKKGLKNQLESLAQEMIKEIKDLKDLTKENLPEVAKEYVRYNTALYLAGTVGFGIVFVLGVASAVYGFAHEGYSHESPDSATAFFMFGLVATLVGFIAGICNFSCYLSFKLQPRRKAIEGITSLL